MENETKEQLRSIYQTFKETTQKIARQQDELRRLYELIDYKEGQRKSLVSDLGKVEERNRELAKELHQLKLDYGVYDKEREERIKYFS